jgi:hypothetical protein
VAVAIGATATLAVSLAGTANAATPPNGICEVGEFCLYYQTGLVGSLSDFNTTIPNHGDTQPTCYEFKTPGRQGLCVKNNARSVWNRRQGFSRVYVNSFTGRPPSGAYDSSGPGWRDLSVTDDNNAGYTVS